MNSNAEPTQDASAMFMCVGGSGLINIFGFCSNYDVSSWHDKQLHE